MTTRPYRHELIVLDQNPTVVTDESENAVTSYPIEPVEEALKRIEQTKQARPERIVSWALHPDERVGMAMLEAHERRNILGGENVSFLKPLIDRQLNEARKTGILWTPILDKVAALFLWDRAGVEQDCLNWLRQLVPWIRNQKDPASLQDLLRFECGEIWQLVANELKTIDDELLELLLTRYENAPYLAANPTLSAKHLDMIGEWFLQIVEDAFEPKPKDRNEEGPPPETPDTQNLRVVSGIWLNSKERALFETLETLVRKRKWSVPAGFIETLKHLGRGDLSKPEEAETFQEHCARELALQALLMFPDHVSIEEWTRMQEEKQLPFRVLDEVIQRAAGNEELELRLGRTVQHPLHLRKLLKRGYYRVRELASRALEMDDPAVLGFLVSPEVDPDLVDGAVERLLDAKHWNRSWKILLDHAFTTKHLIEMFRRQKLEPGALELLVTHRAAGPELWRAMAQESRSPTVRKALASHAPARSDEEVRRILIDSSSPDVLYALCEDERSEELPDLIRRLSKAGDERVLEVLKKAPDEILEQLDMDVIAPLLALEDSKSRVEAIMLVGRFTAAQERKRMRAASLQK